MPDTVVSVPSDLRRDLKVEAITSTIVDVSTVPRRKLSQTSVTAQNYVIVELRLLVAAAISRSRVLLLRHRDRLSLDWPRLPSVRRGECSDRGGR
jgi:hypothetical protein